MDKSLFLKEFIHSKLIYITNRSFYPDKSHLILAAWFASINERVIVYYNFILSVLAKYIHLFIAEIYRVLLFMAAVDYILIKYPNSAIELSITISSNSLFWIYTQCKN